MKTLAFIGHSHHAVTKSSHFFKRHIAEIYNVVDFSIDPSDSWEDNAKKFSEIMAGNYDGIVLWQIDYLGSYFLRRGVPVIICPMYDSSSILESSHWKALRGSLIISFSLELQWIIAKAGVESLYIKYFPYIEELKQDLTASPAPLSHIHSHTRANGEPLKAFFWERLPDSSISSQNVITLLGKLDIGSLHIHQAPDPGQNASRIHQGSSLFPITTSSWFDSSKDYHDKLRSADIFIAPRFAEGIGMSFLEAMGHGCCVIANDMATHNEYIENWKTGILVDFGSEMTPLTADSSALRIIGNQAKRNAWLLRDNWESFYLPLMLRSIDRYLDGFADNGIKTILGAGAPQERDHELRNLFAAHNDWDKYYTWLDLISHVSDESTKAEYSHLISSTLIDLEQRGDYHSALSILDSAIQEHHSSSIYSLFKNQLLERMKLGVISQSDADQFDRQG
jgi:hypothetical protein